MQSPRRALDRNRGGFAAEIPCESTGFLWPHHETVGAGVVKDQDELEALIAGNVSRLQMGQSDGVKPPLELNSVLDLGKLSAPYR